MIFENGGRLFNTVTFGVLFMAASMYISPTFRQCTDEFGAAAKEVVSILCKATWIRFRLLQHWMAEHPLTSLGVMWVAASFVQSPEIRQAWTITVEIVADACVIVAKDVWALCKNVNHLVNNFFCRRRPPGSGFFY